VNADGQGRAEPRKFGPFQIEDQLGVGGMGIVYRAKHLKTGQTVALKVLTPALSTDEGVKKRFNREMEILKRLDHKNVVKYYGGGTVGTQHFYAMELLEGGTVEDLLKKKGRLSWEQTIEVGKSVARALEHAHYYGIIHRDLKPANLFLTKEGRLKLGDFGIARDTERTALTAAGKTVGTYAYMAPEQITGDPPVSRKTDLYSLGCVLFELLTGRPPFEAENAAQMLMQHIEMKPPRVSSLCADCPIWLEALIEKLLEKEPDDRYFDALAVHTALKDVSKKVAEGAGISKQTVAGDMTVVDRRNDPELRKLLGRKKKKKKGGHQPFYERAWFLAACLALLVGGVTWAVWPMSDAKRFARGKELMEQAAQSDVDADERLVLMQDAREKYFEPLMERSPDGPHANEVRDYLRKIEVETLRRQAEVKIRFNREPSSGAERLYMDARRAEKSGDRMRALGRYARLIKLVQQGRDNDRPYAELAAQRRDVIYGKGASGNVSRELVLDALKRADKQLERGEIVAAEELLNAIVNEFAENTELAPQVKKARERLDGLKKR
jgi:eukaryotic-like serine/threonine-protein kinase